MRKTILAAAAAVAVTMLSGGTAAAQTAGTKAPADPAKIRAEIDKAIEAMRKDARAGKSDILGKTMALDANQAAAFWPLYKAYEAELQTVNNERLAIIQDLAEHFDTLDDAKAKGLLDQSRWRRLPCPPSCALPGGQPSTWRSVSPVRWL